MATTIKFFYARTVFGGIRESHFHQNLRFNLSEARQQAHNEVRVRFYFIGCLTNRRFLRQRSSVVQKCLFDQGCVRAPR